MLYRHTYLIISLIMLSVLPTFALPDINVTAVQSTTGSAPPPGKGGEIIQFWITNSGDSVAASFTIGAYSAQAQSCTVTQGQRLLDSLVVTNLQPGQTLQGTFLLTAAPGDVRIHGRIRADIFNQVTESNENNNCRSSFSVLVSYPDLIIQATAGPAPLKFVPGEAGGEYFVQVANVEDFSGDWDAGPSTTGYYLSAASSNPPGSDRLPDLSSLTPPIDKGNSYDHSITITVPEGTPLGSYNLFAKADANNEVPEGSFENNNFSFRRPIEVVDICTFSDFNENGTVDILDLIELINQQGQTVWRNNKKFNVKKSHHPFPESINTVDLFAALNCWGTRSIGEGGQLHDFDIQANGSYYDVNLTLSGRVSSIETLVALPAGTQFWLGHDAFDLLDSNYVTTRSAGPGFDAIYSNNNFQTLGVASKQLAYNSYRAVTFNTQTAIDLSNLIPLAPGEVFTTGVAVQIVFEDGSTVMQQKKFDYVHAKDANVRAAIQTQLGLHPGDPIPTVLARSIIHLNLDNANISDLSGLEQLKSLAYLSLANNNLSQVPDLSNFHNLRSLDLSNNQIYTFPKLPTRLETLSLANNQLYTVPNLSHLTHLDLLDVSGNQLVDLPAVTNMPALDTLVCANNKIMQLPTLPTRLRTLNADHNHLQKLPTFASPIQHLSVQHNFISDVKTLIYAVDQNTVEILLDHNNLHATFCEIRSKILKLLPRVNSLQTYSYSHQLLPDGFCISGADSK